MAALTVNQIDLGGVEYALESAAAGGDTFVNNGKSIFVIDNADASPHTVTFNTPGKIKGVDIDNPAVTIPAGETHFIGPFDTSIFNGATGTVAVTYDGVTSVTVGVFSL